MGSMTLLAAGLALLVGLPVAAQAVERWGIYAIEFQQEKEHPNPFIDVWLRCRFEHGAKTIAVDGFHDGGDSWKVRFMPMEEGRWTYATESNDPGLNGKSGSFECGPPSPGNHGPIRVTETRHFSYADGTPYFQVGTTCYAWAHQGEALEEQTLATLRDAPFNKLRMCVFPKDYVYNKNEPEYYPFKGTPPRDWDFTRFNPEFFRHFERRIEDLMALGIQADLILFHPYDRWGFAEMPAEADDRYLRYVVARLAAYRNVWWSMANEFDLMKGKSMEDWDRFFQIVRDADPYDHPRSVHNCRQWYDHTKPWVTHASIQTSQFGNAVELRGKYQKPLVYDEVRYEGDVPQGWGNLTAEELVEKFWLGTVSGCYVGHGETYKHPEDILWWSKGGVLHGQSPARIAFLKQIMEELPFQEMAPDRELAPGHYALVRSGEHYLVYCTSDAAVTFDLPGDGPYRADGIDTWGMTVAPLNDVTPGQFTFAPPRRGFVLRLEAYAAGETRRPRAQASAEPSEGAAPLRVRFAGPEGLRCRWEFGDGERGVGPGPVHVYERPGLYAASLTVTDEGGHSATTFIPIAVDFAGQASIIRVGLTEGDSHPLTLHGDIRRTEDGALDLGDGEPWKWVSVGEGPIADLEGLRSFTILGWVCATNLEVGSGGNRVLCNLNYDRAGVDLVHLSDGRLRLAVNEWPDHARNDSSPGKLELGAWTFFAVTYDSTQASGNVHWYFGGVAEPAKPDTVTDYARGATGTGSGPLTVGNYNEPLHRHGLDRQFRGRLRGIEIIGSRVSSRGVLPLAEIRRRQQASAPR